jgi:hypothetical protein
VRLRRCQLAPSRFSELTGTYRPDVTRTGSSSSSRRAVTSQFFRFPVMFCSGPQGAGLLGNAAWVRVRSCLLAKTPRGSRLLGPPPSRGVFALGEKSRWRRARLVACSCGCDSRNSTRNRSLWLRLRTAVMRAHRLVKEPTHLHESRKDVSAGRLQGPAVD